MGKCKDCEFWDIEDNTEYDKSSWRRSCKRYPSEVLKKGYDWCGEFKEKEK